MQLVPRYDSEPVISIEGLESDPVASFARHRRRFARMLSTLDEAQWAAPSRCEGWSVADVVAHLVSVTGFWTISISSGLAGEPTRYLAGFDPAVTPELLVEPMRTLAREQLVDELIAADAALLEVLEPLDESQLDLPAEAPPGWLPIRLVVLHALWDSWVHERDICVPLGLPVAAEPDELLGSLAYATALSPAFACILGGSATTRVAIEAKDPSVSMVIEADESVVVHLGVSEPGLPHLRGDAALLVDVLSLRGPLPVDVPPEWDALLDGLRTAFDAT